MNNSEAVLAYKLIRKRSDGTLGPLFINRNQVIPLNTWLQAECIPTEGFAVRKGWHVTKVPLAPHLKMQTSNGDVRVWMYVEVKDYVQFLRPECQGGAWLLAQWMRVLAPVLPETIADICRVTQH